MREPPPPVDPEALLAHAGWLRRVAERLVRDPARADDAVQEAWVAALRHPPRHDRNLASWLAGLVRSAARDARRGEARRERREARGARLEALPSAAELVEQAELQRELVTALLALDEPYRSTLLLRFYHDRRPKEIADLQGIPAATVRSRLGRGLEQLRAQLDRRFQGDRRAWAMTLLAHRATPVAPEPAAPLAGASSSILGVTLMSLKTQLALASGLVALAAIGWWVWPSASPAAPRPDLMAARTGLDAPAELEPADTLETPAVREAVALQRASVTVPTAEALATYHGVVRDPAGAPIEGATLELHYNVAGWQDEPPVGAGTSDAEGRFRIEAAADPDPSLLVFARAEGHSQLSKTPVVPEQEIEIELPWVTELVGVVADAETGEPVAGATVSTWTEKVTAGADGTYRLTNVVVGRKTDLWATADGYAEHGREVTLREPRETRLDFALPRGVAFTLETFDAETGAPVGGAELRRYPGIGEPFARTDDEGRVELRVVDGGELQLMVKADGYGPFVWLWDVAGAAELSPRIPMLGWAWLEGTVLGAEGEPVQAFAYAEHDALSFERFEMTGPEREAQGLPGLCWYEYDGSGRADEQGQFWLGVLPHPEPYSVRVSDKEHVTAKAGPFLLASPGDRASAVVRLGRGAVVRGRALHNGQPWGRGSVLAEDAAGELLARAWVAAGGEYELRVPPGEVRLSLHDTSHEALAEEIALTAEEGHEYRRDFSWDEEMATITGRILDPSGAPLEGVVVSARAAGSVLRAAFGRSDDDGRYVIEVPASGTYDVSARNGPASDARKGVPAGATDVDLVLPTLGTLRLRLVDAASGAPIGGFDEGLWSLAWRPSGSDAFGTLRTEPDVDGIVELELPVGRVDVSLFLADEGFAPRQLDGLPVTEQGGEIVSVELERGVGLTLTFESGPELDREGMRGHLIFVLEESELDALRGPFPSEGGPSNHRINGVNMWLAEPGFLQRLLDVGGNEVVRVGGLAPGRYWLRAYPDAFVFEPESFEVGREDVSLTVRWRRR